MAIKLPSAIDLLRSLERSFAAEIDADDEIDGAAAVDFLVSFIRDEVRPFLRHAAVELDPAPFDPLEFHEQGEANEYCHFTRSGKWFLAFRMNGELWTDEQRAICRRLAACWKACSAIETDRLEAIPNAWDAKGFVDTVLQWKDQRDELQAENNAMKREITAKFDGDYLRRVLATAKGKP